MSSNRLIRIASRVTRTATPRSPLTLSSTLPRRRTFWSSSAPTETPLELASNSIPSISDSLLPIILAVVLASSSSQDDDDNASSPPWRVEATSKGFGAFATRQLQLGELLIAERPLCIWPQGLSEAQAKEHFQRMSDKEQKVFLQLSRTEGDGPVRDLDEIRAIRATNGFSLQMPGTGVTAGFVFPRIARINHSCAPNCSQSMNFETLRMEVYAITPIASSTEISIDYLPLITSTRAERQRALKESFGFSSCLCPVCTASPEEVEKSDARRREIKQLGEGVRTGKNDRKGTIIKLERIRVLLQEEGYQSLPEFEDMSVSNAYAVYAGMYQRSLREGRE
ncbi:hypothetical protein BCR35DRAFT_309615 [Leucosporidium creatinivorum]|uniref:SET domain-containing protein n=1 Tax=Leucosporidium creatinivorum TaxID=106004 RepID=A0A1Y2DG95_9BASI|nr:hypothetical protein BCR35DRAFT_309615 [Leucosporidium creatinivorum]